MFFQRPPGPKIKKMIKMDAVTAIIWTYVHLSRSVLFLWKSIEHQMDTGAFLKLLLGLVQILRRFWTLISPVLAWILAIFMVEQKNCIGLVQSNNRSKSFTKLLYQVTCIVLLGPRCRSIPCEMNVLFRLYENTSIWQLNHAEENRSKLTYLASECSIRCSVSDKYNLSQMLTGLWGGGRTEGFKLGWRG